MEKRDLLKLKEKIKEVKKKVLEEDRIRTRKLLALEVAEVLKPLIGIGEVNKEEIVKAIENVKIEIHPPEVKVPKIEIPEIKVPEVKIPKIEIPKTEFPEVILKSPKIKFPPFPETIVVRNFSDFLKAFEKIIAVRITGVTEKNPLPVILTYDNKFYQAILGAIGGPSRVFIKDKQNQTINPATEETLAKVLALQEKSVKNVTGTISATTTIISAVAQKKIKITAFSLITSSTTAVTCTFKDGVGGTAKWTIPLQALSGTISGANLATSRPDCLFETAVGNALELNLSATASVVYSLSYFNE